MELINAVDVRSQHWSIDEWSHRIERLLDVDRGTAIFNVDETDTREYDAIFLGGGAGGRGAEAACAGACRKYRQRIGCVILAKRPVVREFGIWSCDN